MSVINKNDSLKTAKRGKAVRQSAPEKVLTGLDKKTAEAERAIKTTKNLDLLLS